MTDIADLGLAIRSDGVVVAKDRLKDLETQSDRTEKAVERLIASVTKLVGAYASWRIVESAVRKYIDSTAEAERVQAQLTASLQSTNAVSGQTVDSLNAHANALKQLTTYDDEAINGAQALLLTFTRIRGDVFPQATEATLNLATAMRTDLRSAALQVGKALNDPVLGMTALSRAGIQFTDEQKRMVKGFIESNDLISAQKVVLKELENQFGGSARAARGTLGGALTALGNAWDDLFEASGGGAERLRQSVEDIIATLTDPAFVESAQTFASTILDALGQVLSAAKGFMDWFNSLGGGGDQFAGVTNSDLEKNIARDRDLLTGDRWLADRPGVTRRLSEAEAELRNRQNFDPLTAGTRGSSFDFRSFLDKPVGGPTTPINLGPTDEQIAALEKAKKAYDALTLSMRQKIADSQLEQRTIGMTTDEITRLTNRHDVLAEAEKKGLKLTADQRDELLSYADQLSDAEIATRKLQEAQEQLDDIYAAFGDTIAEVFGGSIKTIDEFFDHLSGGLTKIGQGNISKLFSADGLQNSRDAWSGGAKDDSWSEARAKTFGKSVGEGFGDFMKDHGGKIAAGLGGFGMGYQSQNPLMGAAGGALAGASAGPWGAVIGGIAGFVGGLIGMNEALEKAKKAVSDNRASIDQFIATGMGKEVDEIAVAVGQFKAQGAQLVELAKAAGDTALVARLNDAMKAYEGTLRAQKALDGVRDRFEAAQDALVESYRRQADEIGNVVDRTRDFIASITDYRDSLKLDRQFSPLNPQGMLGEARSQFDLLVKQAKLGDPNAQSRLQGAAGDYLSAARGYYGSSDKYQDVFQRVDDALAGVLGRAGTQLSNAERQLEAANNQLTKLGDIEGAVLTIPAAIKQLRTVTAEAAKLQGDAADKLLVEIKALNKKLGINDLKKPAKAA